MNTFTRCFALLLTVVITIPALAAGVYHEAFCPSVDTLRMNRMTRGTAVAAGLVHAADCDPSRVRYLGIGGGWEPPITETSKTVHVSAYTKQDGTQVRAHERSYPRRN